VITRPIAALAMDHPGADPNRFGSPAEVAAASMTLYGVTLDGVHYVSGCETRFGPYPFCEKLTFPLIRWLSRSSARSQACAWLCFILMF